MINGRYIDVDGINTYYFDVGEGPAIVLMHGAAPTSEAYGAWAPQLEALSEEFRVIAFDEIGFGRTDIPEEEYYNRFQRVDHAVGFLRAMEIEGAVLVGHSEGGFMATRIAIVAPELCSRLVIVTSGGTSPLLGGGRDEAWFEAAATAYDWTAVVDEDSYLERHRHLALIMDPDDEPYLRETYRRAVETGRVEIWQNLPEEETDYTAYCRLQEEHIFPHLGDLGVPTLLIWATEDKTVPVERGLKLLELIPNAEMHVFTQAAHMVMHDQAAGFNRILAGFSRP